MVQELPQIWILQIRQCQAKGTYEDTEIVGHLIAKRVEILSREKCDILVFGPHPDDEALGCANVISQALSKKKKVKVIVVAYGESSVEGTKWFYGHEPEKEDYINIGYVRQKESLEAMKVLGLKEEDIIFLGYPNDGLLDIISSEDYTPDNPYLSAFTGFEKVSHNNSYNMGAPYCRESIYKDVRKILNEFDPDRVYVTHPLDSHNDHKACGKMVYDLAKEFKRSIKVRCYLISPSRIPSERHRMIYKFVGQLKEKYLGEQAKELKRRCIEKYESQSFLFKELAFHYDVERFFKLEHGPLAKIIKELKPDLVY
jgi:LmbE family N-acetylglucosaminyl deacetylase